MSRYGRSITLFAPSNDLRLVDSRTLTQGVEATDAIDEDGEIDEAEDNEDDDEDVMYGGDEGC